MMRKFRFNLQRLLDYREMVEESLLAELASLQAEHEMQSARLKEMKRYKDLFREKMKQQLAGGTADEIRAAHEYLQQIVAQCLAQEVLVQKIKTKRDIKTAAVIEASKERKVLERLKEHKTAEHRSEDARQEQKFLDDIASIRFNRSRSADGCKSGGAV